MRPAEQIGEALKRARTDIEDKIAREMESFELTTGCKISRVMVFLADRPRPEVVLDVQFPEMVEAA